MKLKRLIILFLTCLLSVNLFAQGFSLYKYEFYAGAGGSNLMGDICAPKNSNQLVWVKFFNTIGFVGNTGFRYRFDEKQYANLNMTFGQLFVKDPIEDSKYWDAGRKANSFFVEITGRYEYVIVKERMKKTVYRMLGESFLKNVNIPTYLFIGAGGMYNIGNYSKTINKGQNVQKEFYSAFSVVIPYGIGFKTRLTNTSQLNVEVGLRFALSDNIDYSNKERGGGRSWFDQYQFITFNYVKKLRSNQKGLPKF